MATPPKHYVYQKRHHIPPLLYHGYCIFLLVAMFPKFLLLTPVFSVFFGYVDPVNIDFPPKMRYGLPIPRGVNSKYEGEFRASFFTLGTCICLLLSLHRPLCVLLFFAHIKTKTQDMHKVMVNSAFPWFFFTIGGCF